MSIVNITVDNDADFYQQFQYATALGVGIIMTGASLEMMLRRNAADETAVIRFGTDTGEFVITDPINGLFTFYIAQNVLEQLGLGDYAHSLIMTIGTNKTKIWGGTFTNNAGPTR